MNSFLLDILTPERLFFSEQVDALVLTTLDGALCILKDHEPITVPLLIGCVHIKQNKLWRKAFQSEGFLEFDGKKAGLFVQACEWPENINASRAEDAKKRAEERLRQQHSMREYRWSQASLARAMARLRVSQEHINLD